MLTWAFVDRVSKGYDTPTPIAPPMLPANRLAIVAVALRLICVELLSPPPRTLIAGWRSRFPVADGYDVGDLNCLRLL